MNRLPLLAAIGVLCAVGTTPKAVPSQRIEPFQAPDLRAAALGLPTWGRYNRRRHRGPSSNPGTRARRRWKLRRRAKARGGR